MSKNVEHAGLNWEGEGFFIKDEVGFVGIIKPSFWMLRLHYWDRILKPSVLFSSLCHLPVAASLRGSGNGLLSVHFSLIFSDWISSLTQAHTQVEEKLFNLLQAFPEDLGLRDEPEKLLPRQDNCKVAVDEAFLGHSILKVSSDL